jgi:hypothetical protein
MFPFIQSPVPLHGECRMGLDRYKVSPNAFERFYDVFLQNSMRGRRYKIELESGDTAVGVPTSGSIANPLDPSVSFAFRTDDGNVYRIPFAHLKDAAVAEPVSCMVRTIDPFTLGGGDFEVMLDEPESERLLVTSENTTVRGRLRRTEDFVDGAPRGTYKFLTVRGSDFVIGEIRRDTSPDHILISVAQT